MQSEEACARRPGHDAEPDGRPVIGVANTASDLSTCNTHLRFISGAVKRGILSGGGVPVEFPSMSLGEVLTKPTTMLYRNLMAMAVEECIRAYPLDAVVLLSGCDKTTPAMLMGAVSADIPAILFTVGPMLAGHWRGRQLGSGADAEDATSRSPGHCMVTGTAATMACMAEALGMSLGDTAGLPAVDSRRATLAEDAGRRAVELAIASGPRPSQILTEDAFDNAIRALMAMGGSTNAVIHLTAIAGRAGVRLPLEKFEALSRTTPLLVNMEPSGNELMEAFHYAGGLPAVLKQLLPLLHRDAITVSGKTIGESVSLAQTHDEQVIRPLAEPLAPRGGMAFLTGNLCPDGAVIKVSAASASLLHHRGPAVVFEDVSEMWARCLDETAQFDPDCVIVLRGGGPKGAPGMPEWGEPLVPASLLKQGVTDIVRITDARMSGTSSGTTVLHVTPESAVGGPLALVRDGDIIELDTSARQLNMLVEPAELERRRSLLQPAQRHFERGYGAMFMAHVLPASEGCDFDFLRGATPAGPFAAARGA